MWKVPEGRSHGDSADGHHYGHEWLSHFDRQQRHQLVNEDRQARGNIARILFLAMGSGLAMVITLFLLGYFA